MSAKTGVDGLPITVKVAVGTAFVQAGVGLVSVVLAGFDGSLLEGSHFNIYSLNIYSLLDVITLSGLAAVTLGRRLWGAYALVAYATLDYAVKVVAWGHGAWIITVVLYVLGAIGLHASRHTAPRWRDLEWRRVFLFTALWSAGNFVTGFLSTFALTRGAIRAAGAGVDASVPTLMLFIWSVWGILICFLAARGARWPLETVLLVAAVSVPLGALDLTVVTMSPVQFVSRGLWGVAYGVAGYWITRALAPTSVAEGAS